MPQGEPLLGLEGWGGGEECPTSKAHLPPWALLPGSSMGVGGPLPKGAAKTLLSPHPMPWPLCSLGRAQVRVPH